MGGLKGERHETMIGRPVSMHAMRGISAHSNGFQTCRALHILQILIGSVETPADPDLNHLIQNPHIFTPRPAGKADQVKPDPTSGRH